MITPPPMGGGSKTGAQESPSMSDVEIEYDIIPPDKGRGKAVPNNTVQGGSRHDPPREWERMSHLSRWNESDDRLQSHSVNHCLTTRSDNEEIWDELTSKVNRVVKRLAEIMAEAIRKAEEGRTEMQASIASLNQCINALRKSYWKRGETSHSWDGWSQTCHTRNDELGLPPQRDSHPIREGHEQDGPTCHPSNEPNDRSPRLSPQNSQRNLDEETLVDIMARCDIFTLLSKFSLITIELEPDVYMTVVTVYDKRYSCLSKTMVTCMHVTITTLQCT